MAGCPVARQEQQGFSGGISLSLAQDAAVLGKALKLCRVFFLGLVVVKVPSQVPKKAASQ